MNRSLTVVGLSALILMNGCATIGESTLMGTGVGAAAGTGIGLAMQKSPGSALIGAGIGAVLGSALFYLGHKVLVKDENPPHPANPISKLDADSIPAITSPDVVCHQVDPKIESDGTKWISGHTACEIKKQSVWSK